MTLRAAEAAVVALADQEGTAGGTPPPKSLCTGCGKAVGRPTENPVLMRDYGRARD